MLFDIPVPEAASQPANAGSASTQSLYRKYRPTSFADDDLVGQEHVVHTLRNSIALGRVSHAYLFCGPRGTGKTTTARLMAKAVNCLDPDPHKRPCNQCAACVAINTNATTDVIEIDAASNRGIDDIRDLRERVKYAPTQLKTKFYIIDEAHQITGAAANAFLKTLEEPPPHTRFILATTDPEELLSTIVSRCQRFDFRRISLDSTVARLRTVADQENIVIEDDALPVIARMATGSLRDALGMLDQLAVYKSGEEGASNTIDADLARAVLGVSRNERIEALTTALADRDPASGLRQVNDAVEAGEDVRQLGKQLITYLRELMLVKAGGSEGADRATIDMAERFSLDDLARLVRGMVDLDFRAKRASLPQLPLELAIVQGILGEPQQAQAPAATSRPNPPETRRPASPEQSPARTMVRDEPPPMAYEEDIDDAPLAPRVSLKDRVRGTATAGPRNSSPPRPDPASTRSQVQESPIKEVPRQPQQSAAPEPPAERNELSNEQGSLSVEGLVDLWPKIRADVKATNRRIEALLQMVDPAAVNGNKVMLVSPYEFHRNRINSDDVRLVIEGVIGRLVGTTVLVTCMAREDIPRQGAASEPTSPARPAPPPEQSTSSRSQGGSGSTNGNVSARHEPAPEIIDELVEQQQKDDEQRVLAARNIFDADEIIDD